MNSIFTTFAALTALSGGLSLSPATAPPVACNSSAPDVITQAPPASGGGPVFVIPSPGANAKPGNGRTPQVPKIVVRVPQQFRSLMPDMTRIPSAYLIGQFIYGANGQPEIIGSNGEQTKVWRPSIVTISPSMVPNSAGPVNTVRA